MAQQTNVDDIVDDVVKVDTYEAHVVAAEHFESLLYAYTNSCWQPGDQSPGPIVR